MRDEAGEAHDPLPIGGAFGCLFGLHGLGRFGAGNWRGPFRLGGNKLGVVEQKRGQGVPQMPLDVIGEHAQEDMSPHPRCGPMADRPDIEIDRLQTAEGTFDTG